MTQTSAPQLGKLQGMNELEGFIRDEMRVWKVPGVAVGIVVDGEVAYTAGFGYRDVENQKPVSPDTLFAIASCTKAMTTMTMGMLVDEGKLDWDQPVRNYLPSFQLDDSFASERITPRDLVTHRTGLPRHDNLWYLSPFSRREMIDRLRHLEMNKDLRAAYQYNNLMFMAAGYLVGEIAGTTWEEFASARILRPLGMSRTNFSVTVSQQDEDYALPYYLFRGKPVKVPFAEVDALGPAGAGNSCVNDMVKWIQFQLAQGEWGGERLISTDNIRQMQSPQMIQEPSTYSEFQNPTYGLGWYLLSYRGHQVVRHGGQMDGFSAVVSMVPSHKLGIVVLTNMNETSLPGVIAYRVIDLLLGLEPIDWSTRFQEEIAGAKREEEAEREKDRASRKEGTTPSHSLLDYQGVYTHPAYGEFRVHLEGDILRVRFNGIDETLTHYHYDVFRLEVELWNWHLKVSFQTDNAGQIASLAVPLEANAKPITFTRVASM